jgi:hypothetical protein
VDLAGQVGRLGRCPGWEWSVGLSGMECGAEDADGHCLVKGWRFAMAIQAAQADRGALIGLCIEGGFSQSLLLAPAKFHMLHPQFQPPPP